MKPSLPKIPLYALHDLSGGEVGIIETFRGVGDDRRAAILEDAQGRREEESENGEPAAGYFNPGPCYWVGDLTVGEVSLIFCYRRLRPFGRVEILAGLVQAECVQRSDSL